MPTSSVTQYRKQIGLYDNKPKKTTKKSMIKAIRKAHNSHESIRTHRNRSSANTSSLAGTVLKTMVILAVAASVMAPVGAMENGVRNPSGPAESTFLHVGFSSSFPYLHGGSCSGLKINDRQIVSAKHCGAKSDMHIWARTRYTGWEWANHREDHPDPNVDLAIFTFPEDLAGYTYCVPLMTEETRDLLEISPKNICGLEERVIIEGRGRGSDERNALFSYVYDLSTQNKKERLGWINPYEKRKITTIKGMKHNDRPVCTHTGDSGGPVVGCNPKTGNYEIMGFNVLSKYIVPETCASTSSGFVDTAYYPELRSWLLNNTQPCISTDGYSLQPNDFFKSNNHNWDRCNIPEEYDTEAGISIDERCNCYYKNFQTPPDSANCPSNNKDEADGTSTTKLVTASTVEPDTISTTKPSTTSTTEPDTTLTTKPSTTSTTKPTTTSTTKPTTISTTEPDTTLTTKPSTVSTTEPDTTSTTKPSTVSTTKPDIASTTVLDTISTTEPDPTAKQNKPTPPSKGNSIKFAAGAAFAAMGVATAVACCKKTRKKVQFDPVATNPPTNNEDLTLQPLTNVSCH